MINPDQKLHFADGQLFTTFHGVPEAIVATTEGLDEGLVEPELIAEVCKRFKAYRELVFFLSDYMEDDENRKNTSSGLYQKASAFLASLR